MAAVTGAVPTTDGDRPGGVLRTIPDGWFLAALVALVAAPLAVAAIALRRPLWTPVLDLAMTEVRVRDVGTADTPLIGLPGRIGDGRVQGSHPGPLSFWLLAPVYRLAGSTAWGLHLAVALLDLVAISIALVFAHRRGRRPLAAAVALVMVVLGLGYGVAPLVEPWNPYLPLLWWVVVVLCAWSVLCGDLVALPVLAFAASLCAQTHVPYLALCLGIAGLAVVGLVLGPRLGGPAPDGRWRWLAATAGLSVLLWLPPTLDQAVNDPGNYRLLIDHFGTPPEDPVGLRAAGTEVLAHFDLFHLVVDQLGTPGLLTRGELGTEAVPWRGALVLAAWGAAAVLAWRRSPLELRRLHAVLAVATALGWYSISRIFGTVWFYLTLWLWAVAALAVVAAAWSAALRLRSSDDDPAPRAWRAERSTHRWLVPVLVGLAAAGSLRSLVVAPDAEPSDWQLSEVLVELVDPTADALAGGDGPAPGPDGTYLVGFTDALHIGSQAYGLVSELERRGFDVGMHPAFGVPMTEHRTLLPADADARVQLVTGSFVEAWRALPGAVEVASVDLRTSAEREELEELRASVTARLRALGLDELVPWLDTNLFGAAIDPRAPESLRADMDRMLKIGMPTSVFVAPPEIEGP